MQKCEGVRPSSRWSTARAVIVFISLAAIGVFSEDEATVRGAYLVMAPAAWFALLPLAHASLLSGIALSLGTTWGLFRHYWLVVKLIITLFSTVILLIYMGTFRQMAGVAADPVAELGLVRNPSPLVHGILALILLVVATVLAVYKPFGMTPYGARTRHEQRSRSTSIGNEETTSAAPTAAPPSPITAGRHRRRSPRAAPAVADAPDRRELAALVFRVGLPSDPRRVR